MREREVMKVNLLLVQSEDCCKEDKIIVSVCHIDYCNIYSSPVASDNI